MRWTHKGLLLIRVSLFSGLTKKPIRAFAGWVLLNLKPEVPFSRGIHRRHRHDVRHVAAATAAIATATAAAAATTTISTTTAASHLGDLHADALR